MVGEVESGWRWKVWEIGNGSNGWKEGFEMVRFGLLRKVLDVGSSFYF